jgi:hypothetical protein
VLVVVCCGKLENCKLGNWKTGSVVCGLGSVGCCVLCVGCCALLVVVCWLLWKIVNWEIGKWEIGQLEVWCVDCALIIFFSS